VTKPPLASIRLTLDAISVVLAISCALLLRFGLGAFEVTEATELTVRSHLLPSLAWTVILLIACLGHRLYDEDALVVGSGELQRVGRAVIETSGIFASIVFITQSFQVSRAWFGLTVTLSLAFLWIERRALRRFLESQRRRGRWRRGIILLVKNTETDARSLEMIDEFEILHILTPETLDLYLAETKTSKDPRPSLLIRDGDFDRNEMWKLVMDVGRKGMTSYVLSPLRSVRRDRLTVRELSGNTIVKVTPAGLRGGQAILKRMFDFVLATIFLVIAAPAMMLAALMIRLTSGSPILYRQTRVGAEGRTFSIIKLRTMRVHSEPEDPVWSASGDPRVTTIGGWLRRFGIDELPQLWNVVKGEMSLVGPRPERPEFVDRFSSEIDWYAYRDRLRPGITGWAQANGLRGDTSLESRIEFDNWYIEHWSVLLDLRILVGTVAEVAKGERTSTPDGG
jgi:exopolysaccharide biosynthesis polyprenyl glycosylphosphotransferase